jgi:hypothetical protein
MLRWSRRPASRQIETLERLQATSGHRSKRAHLLGILSVSTALSAPAANTLSGTYKLVVEGRQILDTGEIVRVSNPQGYITYGNDGRMLVLIVRNPSPKPNSIVGMTDQDRAALLRTMTAYGGTYEFDETTIKHHIDISWNEVWTGTTEIRSVTRDGERLVYTTPPFHFHSDGKLSVNTLIWEKIK